MSDDERQAKIIKWMMQATPGELINFISQLTLAGLAPPGAVGHDQGS